MKFASYSDGSRDGQLVVVSRDLTQAHYATHIATRLQAVLEDWNYLAPQLQDVYDNLNAGRSRHAFAFDAGRCQAPLPRTFRHMRVMAYANPAASAQGEPPQDAQAQALPGDALWGPQVQREPVHEALEMDCESQWGVVTADLPAGASAERALDSIRLLLLSQTLVLRAGAGKASAVTLGTACAPVAVTPDELGAAWDKGVLQASLVTQCNGRKIGLTDLGTDMVNPVGVLVSRMAQWSGLTAGTVVTFGLAGVSAGSPRGLHSVAAKRESELAQDGVATTRYLQAGDVVTSEVKGRDGASLFGSVRCQVGASPD